MLLLGTVVTMPSPCASSSSTKKCQILFQNCKALHFTLAQDSDAAYLCCCDYAEPACVIVKHTNPCGIAVRGDLLEAYRLAVRADPISAFGGIVAFNREVDAGGCLQ